jgi:hypothetical protein
MAEHVAHLRGQHRVRVLRLALSVPGTAQRDRNGCGKYQRQDHQHRAKGGVEKQGDGQQPREA